MDFKELDFARVIDSCCVKAVSWNFAGAASLSFMAAKIEYYFVKIANLCLERFMTNFEDWSMKDFIGWKLNAFAGWLVDRYLYLNYLWSYCLRLFKSYFSATHNYLVAGSCSEFRIDFDWTGN
jgi:hypothetical protein